MTSEGTSTNPTNAGSNLRAWVVEKLQANEQLIRENQRKTEEVQKRLEDLMSLVRRLPLSTTETQNALPGWPPVATVPQRNNSPLPPFVFPDQAVISSFSTLLISTSVNTTPLATPPSTLLTPTKISLSEPNPIIPTYVSCFPENPYRYPIMGQIHIPDSANPLSKGPVFAFPPPHSGGGVPISFSSSCSVTPTAVKGEGFTSMKDFEELKDMVFKLAYKESFDSQALMFIDMLQSSTILPPKFKMPDVEKFDGLGCLKAHIRSYSSAMISRGATTEAMAVNFQLTLVGVAKEWFMSLEPSKIATWQKIVDLFYKRYQDNSNWHLRKRELETFPQKDSWHMRKRELETFPQKDNESFTDYVARWREKVAKTLDCPDDEELVRMFLKNLLPVYADRMKYSPYGSVRAVLDLGLRIEDDIRLGLIKNEPSPHRYKGPTGSSSKPSSSTPAMHAMDTYSIPQWSQASLGLNKSVPYVYEPLGNIH